MATKDRLRLWRALALCSCALGLALTLCGARLNAKGQAEAIIGSRLADARTREELARFKPTREPAKPSGVPATKPDLAPPPEADTNGSAKDLARQGGPGTAQLLAERFRASADGELAEIAVALATEGSPEARKLLLDFARSPRPGARVAALEALATLETDDVQSFMLESLSGPEPSAALSYFADSIEPRAIPTLERLARETMGDKRTSAISALFAQGRPAAAAIDRLLHDYQEVSRAVFEAPWRPAELRDALRAVSIARVLEGTAGSDYAFDFLAQDLSRDGREALERAARVLATADNAVNALSRRGDAESLAALSRLGQSSSRAVAEHAECGLISRPDSRSRSILRRATRGPLRELAAAALVEIAAPEGAELGLGT